MVNLGSELDDFRATLLGERRDGMLARQMEIEDVVERRAAAQREFNRRLRQASTRRRHPHSHTTDDSPASAVSGNCPFFCCPFFALIRFVD